MEATLRTLLEIPLVWFALAFLAAWPTMRRVPGAARLGAIAGAASAAMLLSVMAFNVRTAGFLVSFGANVMAIAAAHRNGQAMYHPAGGGQLYSLVYGPYTYLVYEPLFRFTDALTAVKLELLAVGVLTLVALYLLLRQSLPAAASLALLGTAAACLLAVPNGLLGVRGDLWIVLALTVALLACTFEIPAMAAVLAGVCCGFAVDLKATLLLEAALVVVLLGRRHGLQAQWLCAAVTAATAALPFALHGISAANYLAWLRLSGHRASSGPLLGANLLFAALLLAAPLLLRTRSRWRPGWLAGALFVAALGAAILAGAKSGGGNWHLWPLLPFALVWAAEEAKQQGVRTAGPVLAALALAALAVSLRWGVRTLRVEQREATTAVRQARQAHLDELHAILARYPGWALEMAPGAAMQSDLDDLRSVIVAAGKPYGIDMVAAGEALKTQPALLEPLASTVARCGTTWVVPHGEIPFSTLNNNELAATFPQLFPASVRVAFARTHTQLERGIFFDLWSCPAPAQGQPTNNE